MKARLFCFLLFILLTIGCTKQETLQPENQKKESVVEENGAIQSDTEEKETATELMKAIDQVIIPETLEEWLEAKPGILVQDHSRESETSGWPSMIMDLNEESKQYLQEVTEVTKDVDLLFKALIHLYGNTVYSVLLKEQLDYNANFVEPYLPEPELVTSTETTAKTPKPDYAIILLDASSSMLASVDNQSKMNIAKTAVSRFAHAIGTEGHVSLIVYGHGGTQSNKDKSLSCSTIDEIVPMGPFKEEAFIKAVNGVEAKGWTPLAGAIKKAHQLSMNYVGNTIIYIVSDGLETCDGDPVKEASEFVTNQATRHVNIIGFDVDQEAENQLKAVADAGNGEYISANTIEELNSSITQKWVLPSMLDVQSKQLSSPKNSFAYLFTLMDIEKKHSSIYYAIKRETNRFESYIQLMKKYEMISEEVYQKLNEKNESYKEKLNALNDELETEKITEVDQKVDQIDQNIQDWTARMKKLHAEQKDR